MAKLTKQQKRKKNIKERNKDQARVTCESTIVKIEDLSINLETSCGYTSFNDLSNEKYQVIYDAYIKNPRDKRGDFLSDMSKKYGLCFNPEELLEIIIDEFKENVPSDSELNNVVNSATLRWCEIVDKINEAGFLQYSELMYPIIKECEYETDV
ncbi:hypothetical protein [Moritella viscosa]|uniref:Cysteinyl-tRNA synthetase-Cysteine--tRNA ligase n=1 Tax=Moritella viscosa TaxID=80854 RepID=A0A1L0A246_9GAMM|nr:hypothetical protein [Moritella viscosa]SGZ04083.1 Cysteinyl-tRNA synthetase-Cysteine--tRNA ligase [Moritella viscosa]